MADQTTQYVIQVTDQVSVTISDKLAVIADTAAQAGDELTSLQAAISKLNGSGLTSISNSVRQLATSQRTLTSATQAYTRANTSAATAANNLATALPRLVAAAQAASAAIASLSTQTQGFVGWARAMQGVNPAAPINNLRTAAGGTTTSVRGMTAAIGLMNGNLRSGNMLVGRFASGLLNASGAASAVMGAFTAVAAVAVIAEMVNGVNKLTDAWNAASEATRQADAAAVQSGKDIEKIVTPLLSISNLVRALKGQNPETGVTQIESSRDLITQLTYAREEAELQDRINAAKLTGAARDRALAEAASNNAKREQEDATKLIALRDQLLAKTTEQVSVTRDVGGGAYGPIGGQETTLQTKITDPKVIAAYTAQAKAAGEAARELQHQATMSTGQAQIDINKSGIAQTRDTAKAAAKELQNLDNAYKLYVADLDHKVTPNETLSYWQKAEESLKYVTINGPKVEAKQAQPQQQISSRNDDYARTVEGLNDQISSIGAYSVALKEKQELDKLTIQYQKTGIPLTQQETATLREKINVIQENALYQSSLNAMYQGATGPLRDYTTNVRALITLLATDGTNTDKYVQELNRISREYQQAQNPMLAFTERLQNEQALLGKTSVVAGAIQGLQQLEEQYKAMGKTMNPADKTSAYNNLLSLGQTQEASKQYGSLTGADQNDSLMAQQAAAAAAFQNGAISADRYRAALEGVAAAQAEIANNNGMATWATATQAILGQLTKGYTSFTGGATKAFGGFFTTLETGFADGIAHALVFGGSVSKALLNVARQAVAGLISSLIKLGIQWVIMQTIGQSLQAGSVAGASATAGSVAAAWAPAAALASLATLGTNALAADTALSTTVALSDSLALLKFSGGGKVVGPGTSTSDSVPALLSSGEYVVKASAYAAHSQAIEAINNGARSVTSRSSVGTNGTYNNTGGMHIEFHDHAGVAIQAQQLDENSVRVLIHQETPGIIQQRAPSVIASEIANPNSKPSRALQQHTNITRRR